MSWVSTSLNHLRRNSEKWLTTFFEGEEFLPMMLHTVVTDELRLLTWYLASPGLSLRRCHFCLHPVVCDNRNVTGACHGIIARENEITHKTMTWLELEKDDITYGATLHCSVSKHIQSCRKSSSAWITGSMNKRLSNAIDHATSVSHKAVMVKLWDEEVRHSGTSAILVFGQCILNFDDGTSHDTWKIARRKYLTAWWTPVSVWT